VTPQENLETIMASSSYILAEEDMALLERDELRPVRLQLEYLKPELLLQEHKIHSTIVVFGGTRVIPEEAARRRVEELEARVKARPEDDEIGRQLRVARRVLAKCHFYEEARKFGRIVSDSCQITDRRELVVVTGGGPGIMEAANRGAFEAGGESIGFNITIPHEQEPNPYITPELCFQFHYFALRKLHFLMRAKALVAFPGGYGTMDELFEALTLLQTKKVEPLPVVLVGREFWEGAVNFPHFVEEGTIDPEDLDLFEFAETAQEAWDIICAFYALDPDNPLAALSAPRQRSDFGPQAGL
jgi:uncharacterized protein (TIGR00730 family)